MSMPREYDTFTPALPAGQPHAQQGEVGKGRVWEIELRAPRGIKEARRADEVCIHMLCATQAVCVHVL